MSNIWDVSGFQLLGFTRKFSPVWTVCAATVLLLQKSKFSQKVAPLQPDMVCGFPCPLAPFQIGVGMGGSMEAGAGKSRG